MGSSPSRKLNLIYPLILYTPYKKHLSHQTESIVHVLSIIYLRDKRIAVSYMNSTIVIYSIVNERFVTDFVIQLDSFSNDICEIDDNVIIYETKNKYNKSFFYFVKLEYESYGEINKIQNDSKGSIKFCALSNNRFVAFGTGPIKIYSSKFPYNVLSIINEENYCWINMLVEIENKDMLIISKFNDHNTVLFNLSSMQVICSFVDIQIQCCLILDEEHLLLGGKEYIWKMNIEKCSNQILVHRKNQIGSFQSFLMMNDGMVLCGNSQNLVFLLDLNKTKITLLLNLETVNPYPITFLQMIDEKRNQFISSSSQGSICLWNYEIIN